MKPLASLSLDLDNEWSYLRTHGDAAWESFPSYLNVVVPRILEFLAARKLRITFFIIGRDAAEKRHGDVLRAIAEAGHEIGNHSFRHEPWLNRYSQAEVEEELVRAEQAIQAATGQHPLGFRGPGFSFSANSLRALVRRGYRYDATVFPSFLNPLARAYFFATSNLTAQEKQERKALFGTLGDALRPVKPFTWRLGEVSLLELPVTTMPVFKMPIHFSYLLYLSKFSRPLARRYFRFSLKMCRLTATEPSLLLHPLDFLGVEDVDNLAFFPGMDLPSRFKLDILSELLDYFVIRYEPLTLLEHATRIAARGNLHSLAPGLAWPLRNGKQEANPR